MRVAIYHPWIYVKSGLERTLLELKKRSRHDWVILTSHYDAEGTYPELKDMNVTELNRVSVKRKYSEVIKAAYRIFTLKIDPDSYDILVISCDGLGSFLNFRNHSKPVLCICFTPLRAVYDEVYRQKRLDERGITLPLAFAFEAVYKLLDRFAWRHYHHVFAISYCVKQRILRGGLADEASIDVAYPGIQGEVIELCDNYDHYFFLPGRIMWTKNIELGIDAFLKLQEEHPSDFRLVIAGMVDEKSKPYIAALRERAKSNENVTFVVGPTDAEMTDLYRNCYATLFTALNEDLGLTPLEGMTFGKAAIAVNRGGPLETISDGVNGRHAAPTPEAFSTVMKDFVENPDEVRRLGINGLEQARKFTWAEYVNQIDEYLDTL